jgi:hypothetical protein
MNLPANRPPIRINDVDILPIDYRGQRVLTFTQIDKIHGRPDGTASRNFRENRERLTEGDDFYLVDFSQNNEFRPFGIEIPPRGLTVVTETGYLLLVKSFTDDLAWQIQKALVASYFRARVMDAISNPTPALPPILPEQHAALAIPAILSISEALGVPLHYAQVEAVKHAARTYGYDAAPLLARSPAQDGIHDGEIMLEPTELAQHLGIANAKAMNALLRDMGLQTKISGAWEPTAHGQPFCARHAWRSGDKSGYNLKWRLTAIRDLLTANGRAA